MACHSEIEPRDPYRIEDGIGVPSRPVNHRDDEYDSSACELLRRMQRDHFWYRGRHQLLLEAARHHLAATRPPRLIDLGGGCGGWVAYLVSHKPFPIAEVALADSSRVALHLADAALPEGVKKYQIDLLDLGWQARWDGAFLLDVLEHIPDHRTVLRQIHEALAPGAVLFITVPALQAFWTWNDEVAHHQRRYSKSDLKDLAQECGFRVREASYFMFFLSPLLMASRLITSPRVREMTPEQRRALGVRMHEVPNPLVNRILSSIFALENRIGRLIRFPWGTSLLAILEKDPSN
jgi:SAM-dependent methyltransferase